MELIHIKDSECLVIRCWVLISGCDHWFVVALSVVNVGLGLLIMEVLVAPTESGVYPLEGLGVQVEVLGSHSHQYI